MKMPGKKRAARDAGKGGAGGSTARQAAASLDEGGYSTGLWSEERATLLGRIAASMPQVDQLVIDIAARRLGDGAGAVRPIFHGLAGDDARLKVLFSLGGVAPGRGGKGDGFDAAVAEYAAVRRRWRAYVHGLWYTHDSGRTFLAAPDREPAPTFLVAREVKTPELEAAFQRLTELTETLIKLTASELAPGPSPAGGAVPRTRRRPEAARPKRPAPKREPGQRRRPPAPSTAS